MRVMKNTQGKTLCPFVERFIQAEATLYTDEYDSYNRLKRIRHTVCHGKNEWAGDDDGDGIREVHVNSSEEVGQDCAISYAHIAVFTKPICPVMWLSMKWQSIIKGFRPLSFLL